MSATTDERRRQIRVTASVAQLAGVRDFVRTTSAAWGASEPTIGDVVQAVDECVTNSIVHGYRGEPGTVEVQLERTAGDIIVTLRDSAPPFDPTAVPSPDTSLSLEQRRPGGMGVHLARELTDEMRYRRAGRVNELTLVKSCVPVEPAEGG